ncbi:MAG: hypothetical protein EA398_06110 [Deltaproteobacteria bacterium]|nr:MAG: hypothetical protein EA398_06110 [Deltaproteobacteria bacterium]
MALGLDFVQPGGAYDSFLWEIARHGGRAVLLVQRLQQPRVDSNAPGPVSGVTAPVEEVMMTARRAQRLGLTVGIMPIVTLEQLAPGQWRGTLQPPDVQAWFETYSSIVVGLATQAEAVGVELLVVGSELGSLEYRGDLWRQLESRVRRVFSGTVTYSMNWDRIGPDSHQEVFDVVGISGYFEVDEQEATVNGWRQRWEHIGQELEEVSQEAGAPVVLVEYGYRSHPDAWRRPWDHGSAEPVDLAAQAQLLAVALSAMERLEVVSSAYLWNWFGHGGRDDASFSPRNKPAAWVLAEHCRTKDG